MAILLSLMPTVASAILGVLVWSFEKKRTNKDEMEKKEREDRDKRLNQEQIKLYEIISANTKLTILIGEQMSANGVLSEDINDSIAVLKKARNDYNQFLQESFLEFKSSSVYGNGE